MKSKILRYSDFVNENKINEANDTPETYIKGKLMELKKAVDDLFNEDNVDETEEENISINQAKENSNKKSKKRVVSLSEQGVKLHSSEISVYSQTDDSLTVKYSDGDGVYNLYISINIKDGIPKDPNADFSSDDITKMYVKFKKYGVDEIDLIGQTTHNVNIEKEDGEFKLSLNKKPAAQAPAQGQNQQEAPTQEETPESEKMSLLEFLEFLKSDFDDKYGENKGLEYETE
jgi:hypothetical protein